GAVVADFSRRSGLARLLPRLPASAQKLAAAGGAAPLAARRARNLAAPMDRTATAKRKHDRTPLRPPRQAVQGAQAVSQAGQVSRPDLVATETYPQPTATRPQPRWPTMTNIDRQHGSRGGNEVHLFPIRRACA